MTVNATGSTNARGILRHSDQAPPATYRTLNDELESISLAIENSKGLRLFGTTQNRIFYSII